MALRVLPFLYGTLTPTLTHQYSLLLTLPRVPPSSYSSRKLPSPPCSVEKGLSHVTRTPCWTVFWNPAWKWWKGDAERRLPRYVQPDESYESTRWCIYALT